MKNSCIRFALFLSCLLLLNLGQSFGASPKAVGPPFKFNVQEATIPENEVGCVEITVEGFEGVLSLDLGFSFDPTLFRFDGFLSDFLVPGTDISVASTLSPTGEEIINVAILNFSSSFTFPDGTVLFSLCFESLGVEGESMMLEISDLSNLNPSQIFTTGGTFGQPDLCVVSEEITIMNPITFIDAVPTVTAANCQDSQDGSISLAISGGVQPYSVFVMECDTEEVIFGPQDVANVAIISMTLNPGDYCVEISDSSVPSLSQSLTLTVDNNGPSLGARFESIEPLCNGQNNGSIEAFAILDAVNQSNPNTDFSFLWTMTGGQGQVVGPVLSNLSEGTYEVQITEISSGCSITQTTILTEPAALEVDIVATNETCIGNGMDGTTAAVITGGVGGFSFQWDDPSSSTDSLLTNLPQGTYTVVVLDGNNCPATDTESLTVPVRPQILGFDSLRISCPGELDGELEVLFADGSAMVEQIEWVLPDGSTQNTDRLTGIGSGDYTVTLTASDGCTSDMMVTLGAAELIEIDLVNSIIESPECPGLVADFGTEDGAFTIFVIGGTADYTFTIIGPGTNTVLTQGNGARVEGLIAGVYGISVTDVNGCEPATASFTVVDPPSIMVDFEVLQGVSCFGQPPSNGSALATPSNGNGIYNFSWQSQEVAMNMVTDTAFQLMGGMQTLRVTSGNCAIDTFVAIPQPNPIVADFVSNSITCFGGDDGSIDLVNSSGGTGVLTFDFGINGMGVPLTNLPADLYSVLIRDENGCEESVSIEVSQPDSLDAFITDIQNISCNGDVDGLLASAFTGGTVPVSFQWSSGSLDTFSTNTALAAGDYILTVTDSNGCIDTAMASITEPPPILATAVDPPLATCFGEQTLISIGSVGGGNGGPYTYTVNAGPAVPINSPTPVFAGDFTVTVFDGLGCRLSIPVTASEPPPVIVNVGADQEINLGGSTFIFSSIQSSVNIDSIFWIESPGDSTLSCYDCTNPTANPLEDSVYELFAVDDNGCTGSDALSIDVDSDRNVFIPNIFSPNADGFNDMFSPLTGIGVGMVLNFSIYDRWGEEVFNATDFLPGDTDAFGWDGNFRNQPANHGVYLYLAQVEFIDGVILLYRGDVTLTRD